MPPPSELWEARRVEPRASAQSRVRSARARDRTAGFSVPGPDGKTAGVRMDEWPCCGCAQCRTPSLCLRAADLVDETGSSMPVIKAAKVVSARSFWVDCAGSLRVVCVPVRRLPHVPAIAALPCAALPAAAVDFQVSHLRNGSHDFRLVDQPGMARWSNREFGCDPQHTDRGTRVDRSHPCGARWIVAARNRRPPKWSGWRRRLPLSTGRHPQRGRSKRFGALRFHDH
jgi:hypothetical protein